MPLYAINQHLVVDKLHALDVGGSITIHAFGAYYGLAASLVLSISGSGADHHKNGASYSSDMTAMIGTIFLWLFWVSHPGCCESSLMSCIILFLGKVFQIEASSGAQEMHGVSSTLHNNQP